MNAASAPNPYPGLRPFREDEEHLFFGRESQVDAMVDKLAAARFLAVVGTSGSGKSSLVNCGLVPALHRGLMASAGTGWRVATMRPGHRPLRALAQALATALQTSPTAAALEPEGFSAAELIEATLGLGKLGLVEAVTLGAPDRAKPLLLVVDQFEELFRYERLASGGTDDRPSFVSLLLEAQAHSEAGIHVVLTMRSDFLGDCAQFSGLPEAINRGQYLVPRMTRDERREAIDGPARVRGVTLDPVLLTRLVNDVGDNPDQLSILQHALNRTWSSWQARGADDAIELQDYEAIGSMAHALNQHAEEAYAALPDDRHRIACARLFKAITDKTSDARGTRRPTRLDTLVDITGIPADVLQAVIEVFREPSRSFLMPPAGVPLAADSPIDISHESLMRVWDRLSAWADEEARAAQTFRRLAETAELARMGQAGVLGQPDLQFALAWRAREAPMAGWAARYHAGLAEMLAFLQRSEAEFIEAQAEKLEVDRDLRRSRILKWVMAGSLCFVLIVGGVTTLFIRQISEERDKAREANIRFVFEQNQRELAQAAERRAAESQQAQSQAYAAVLADKPQLRAEVQKAVESRRLVYMQFSDAEQKPVIERLRELLGAAGYTTPGSERVRVAPSVSEVRYFRVDDKDRAAELAALLRQWNLGNLKVVKVNGYEARSQIGQFEIWLRADDLAEVARLVARLHADDKPARLQALQTLVDQYPASSAAISEVLALFLPEALGALSDAGRFNALYFLTRTAPLAWSADQQGRGRVVAAVAARFGADSRAEARRLQSLLDAAADGRPTAAVPG